jgi:hypothetical protein
MSAAAFSSSAEVIGRTYDDTPKNYGVKYPKRYQGHRGKSGDKLARKAAEGKLGIRS